MLCSQQPEMLREEDLHKSAGLASTNGTDTTCCSSGTVGIGDIPECQDSCAGSRPLSQTGTEDRILEQELRPTRPGTALSQDAISSHSSICLSRTGALEQDGRANDIVASALSREVVEQVARSAHLPDIGQRSSREGVASVLSLQGKETPLDEALEHRRLEERLGSELAESFSKALSEELQLTGAGTRPPSARRYRAASAPSPEVPDGGLPFMRPQSPGSQLPASLPPAQPPPPLPAVQPPVMPPPPMPTLLEPPAEPPPRLWLETLSEETAVGNFGEEEQGSRSRALSSDWAGCESVASLGTDGGGGLCTLATIDEEVALISILDRVMLDVGGDLQENRVQQLKLMGHGRGMADGLVHWSGQGVDGKPGIVGVQDGAASQRRPESGTSVASLQSNQVVDDRAYCNDFSNQLWQEICARLDGSLLGQPAALGQDCFPPLAQNVGTAT